MAPPEQDPRVTDLARYRKARDQARRQAAGSKPQPPANDSLLGSRPRAGLILVIVLAVLAALYFAPKFMH